MNGPFVLNINNASNLLEMIKDRTGEAILSPILEKTPKFNKEKSKYDTYAQSYWNNGVAKFPKVENDNPKVYLSSIDFEAAEKEALTPLAKIWTDADRKKTAEVKSESLEKTEDNSENVEELCELIREHFDFELKFHIITMIPTTTKLPFERENCTRQLFKKYSDVLKTYCNETVDSVFVTYHKYRVISKTFNTRMQEYLMSSKNGCDSLNIAAIFIRFYSPRTNAFEAEHNIELFWQKYAYLLCFINAKKRYQSRKLSHFEDESMYEEAKKVYECLRACWSEIFVLKTDTETNTFTIGGSLPSFRLNYYNNNVDLDIDDSTNTESKTESKTEATQEGSQEGTEEATEQKTDNEDDPFLQTDDKKEEEETQDEETTEADLVDELNQQIMNNNYMVTSYSRLVSQSGDKKEKLLKKPKKGEVTLEIDTEEIGLNIINENFEKMDPVEFSKVYFPQGIPRMTTEFALTPHTVSYSPVYTYETYLCALIRLSLRKILPDLFSEWYEESHKLFNSITLLNFQGYNFCNNILLHILLEDGKIIPKTVDPSLVKGSVCGGQIEEITFVNFLFDTLSYSFSNDRSFYPSPGKLDGIPKDTLAINSYFHFEELQGYDRSSKDLLRSCFANQVKKINLAPYGDYVYSLGTEIGYLSTLFPNLKEINIMAKSRENTDTTTQMTNVSNATTSDLESSKDIMGKFYEKLYFLFEGRPQKVVDTSESFTDTTTTNDDQETPANINNVFTARPMFDKQEEKRLVVRAMIIAQMDKDSIGPFTKMTKQRLEFLPLLNQVLIQSPGLSVSKKKEIIDYCIKNVPFAAIDTYNYEHTEEKRVLEEYLIYHNNKSEESFLHPDSIIYDSSFHWIHVLLYFGLNIFKNPEVLEEFMFSIMVGKVTKLNGYYFEKTILLDLYISKLFYENGSVELLSQSLAQIADFQAMENLLEVLKKIEEDSNCTEELATDQKVRALQIFFRYFTRPKSHPDFEKQKVKLTADKLTAMLTANYDDIRMIDSLSTLCTSMGVFREAFIGLTCLQSTKSTPDPYSDDYTRTYVNYMDSFDEAKVNRQSTLIQMIYDGKISENEVIPAYELDKQIAFGDAPRMVNTSVLNLLCASMIRSVPFLISLIENLSPEDLLYRDENGNTCLTILCSQRSSLSIEVITTVLDKQPKLINIPTSRLMTPLHLACMDPSNIRLAKLLVTKYGADTNLINVYGLTAYETAATMYLKDLFPTRSVLSGYLSRSYDNMSWLKPTTKLSKKEILKQMKESRTL